MDRFGADAAVSADEDMARTIYQERGEPIPTAQSSGSGVLPAEQSSVCADWAERLLAEGTAAFANGHLRTAYAVLGLSVRQWVALHRSLPPEPGLLQALRAWARVGMDYGRIQERNLFRVALEFTLGWLPNATQQDPEPEPAYALNDYALLLQDMGQASAARRLLEELATTYATLFGEDAPVRLTVLGNLAEALWSTGDLHGAQALAQERLQRSQTAPELGPEHPETLSAANNLATLWRRMGRADEARNLLETTVQTYGRVLPDHPESWTARSNLAELIESAGDFPAAVALRNDTRAALLRLYGSETHPLVLQASINLAVALQETGEYVQAQQLLEEVAALHIREGTEDSPEYLSLQGRLSELLRDTGQLDEAIAIAQKAYAQHLASYGAQSAATLDALAVLAAALSRAQRRHEALPLQQQLVAGRQALFGWQHEDTLRAFAELGQLQKNLGELEAARTTLRGASRMRLQALGAQHPETMYVQAALAEVCAKLGYAQEATAELAPVVAYLLERDFFNVQGFRLAANSVGVLYDLGQWADLDRLCRHGSRTMRLSLELLALHSVPHALPYFRGLHDTWAVYCYHHGLDQIVMALAPLHGLESLSMTLVESATEDNVDGDAQKELIALRQALARCRLDLQHIHAEWRSATSPPLRAQLHQQEQALLETERLAIARYKQVRTQLAERNPEFAAAAVAPETKIHLVGLVLADNEVVLFCVRFRNEQCIAVVWSKHHTHAVPLPDFHLAAEQMRQYRGCYAERSRDHTLRTWLATSGSPADASWVASRDLQSPTSAPEAISLVDVQSLAQASFWTPLAPYLTDVACVHIVTAPEFHTVPLEAGNPGYDTHYYPGIPGFLQVFFRSHRMEDGQPEAVAPLDLAADCAWTTPHPIPFVRAEAELIAALLPEVRAVNHDELLHALAHGEQRGTLVLACHGVASGKPGQQLPALLTDGERGRLLYPWLLAQAPRPPQEVYFSACIAGWVAQELATDALGLVSALQMRSTRAVIACQAAMPDLYMPMLAGLYWHARATGERPSLALRSAKRALLCGQWPNAVLQPITDAYASALQAVLAHAQACAATIDPSPTVLAELAGLAELQALGLPPPPTPPNDRNADKRWARTTAAQLVAQRATLPPDHLQHICALTLCYGDPPARQPHLQDP